MDQCPLVHCVTSRPIEGISVIVAGPAERHFRVSGIKSENRLAANGAKRSWDGQERGEANFANRNPARPRKKRITQTATSWKKNTNQCLAGLGQPAFYLFRRLRGKSHAGKAYRSARDKGSSNL